MSVVSAKLNHEVRRDARNRCGYCLAHQRHVLVWLALEHIHPRAKGGRTIRENLWLACPYCNTFKGSQTHSTDPITKRKVLLFNPRAQSWKRHFKFGEDQATILGKTACGRATVEALNLNFEMALDTRKEWVSVGWYPPDD
jgi:hypothetical protein